MTDNITKLYEVAGVEKSLYCTGCKVWDEFHNCYFEQEETCKKPKEYPPFTAEKQLELIKLFANKGIFLGKTKEYNFSISFNDSPISYCGDDFSETLAMFIVSQHLTDTQKEEIKEILG